MVLITWFVSVSSTATALSLNRPTYALMGAIGAGAGCAAAGALVVLAVALEQAAVTSAVTVASAATTNGNLPARGRARRMRNRGMVGVPFRCRRAGRGSRRGSRAGYRRERLLTPVEAGMLRRDRPAC